MQVVIADKHELFRQSIASILSGLASSELKLDLEETKDSSGLCISLQNTQCDLIVAGLNIFDKKSLPSLLDIRQKHPETAVIAVIENPTPKLMEEFRHHNFNGIICKSASQNSFSHAIKSVLMGGYHYPPCSAKKHCKHLTDTSLFPGTLTKRQEEVLSLLSSGKSNYEIAELLQLSEGTVKVHVTAIFKSLNVKNRTQAMLLSQQIKDSNSKSSQT